ncbi:MAG TPA: sigma 54-interacting transcriptional regulator [Pyrinomonadaceae bacterium]|nr:sigma 54-interacting transcriptional regulator [Pyrinomonadaceae bacterium]
MQPRLAAISGRLKGAVFNVIDEGTVIGRETSANLCIAESAVSRRHSKLEKSGDDYVINDLDSLNGTFVNDVPVKTRVLQHGDRVRVGESQFLFLLFEGDESSKSSQIEIDERQVLSGSTVQVRFDDALYLMARDLSALMKVSTTINAIRGLEELQERLLILLFEVVPAQRGAILLSAEGSLEPTSVFGLDRAHGKDQTVIVSRTIIRQVMRDGVSLLTSNTLDPNLGTDSLISAGAMFVMCVPLMMFDHNIGVIYLDSTDPQDQFNKDHLQLVTAISGIAAVAIENARQFEWLESENQRLLADVNIDHNMIGESGPMQRVYHFISKVAPTDSNVLITGESGTGKELAARAIHRNSKRVQKPFVAVNCAALTESLLESELFGHEKGAFTGALTQKKGRLEIAEGGTLFLDEIGELSSALQVKLLRVLQEREFERVGGTQTIKIDIRLIAATNRNLEEAIEAGEFRQDLYYRLNVVSFELPALRDRREDIPLLANYFADKYSVKCNRKLRGLSPEARARLSAYDWPGNVRELENAMERALVLGTTDLILPEDLPEALLESESTRTAASATSYHDAVAQTKKQIILTAMEKAKGNYTEAAKLLGVHPNYLHRLVRNLNLKDQIKQ